MGQGFGKFVGSFMRQMQSDEEKKGVPAGGEERRLIERPASKAPEWPSARERDEDAGSHGARQRQQARQNHHPLYDPWGASWWNDPAFGYDPWGRGNSWVDHDWQRRRWQYGWNYGQTPSYAAPYGSTGHPYGNGAPYPGEYEALSPGDEGGRWPGSGYGQLPYGQERGWYAPYDNHRNAFNNEWLRPRDERQQPAADEFLPGSRSGESWPANNRAREQRWYRE
ncbi:MAG: hypothetical protein HQM06_04205 [Magnetococcales bacterium]|nr:hypothetical protein [Magnetococcales bacterium]